MAYRIAAPRSGRQCDGGTPVSYYNAIVHASLHKTVPRPQYFRLTQTHCVQAVRLCLPRFKNTSTSVILLTFWDILGSRGIAE